MILERYPRPSSTPIGLAHVAALVAALGCQSRTSSAGISDSTFVAVMADLRRVATDSASHAAERDSILRHYHVNEPLLDAKARELAKHPDHAIELLHAIDRKIYARPAIPPHPVPPRPPQPLPTPRPDTAKQPDTTKKNADSSKTTAGGQKAAPTVISTRTSSSPPTSRSLPVGRDTSRTRPPGAS